MPHPAYSYDTGSFVVIGYLLHTDHVCEVIETLHDPLIFFRHHIQNCLIFFLA